MLQKLIDSGYSNIFCADGGANIAYKLNIIPDYIIGDLDSAKPEVIEYFKDKSKILLSKGEEDTDVEKVLKFVIKKNYKEAVLLGATGDRLDHSFGNIGILLKYYGAIKIKLIHRNSVAEVHSGKTFLKTDHGEIISIYGFDGKTKFISSGLKYPLNNISLKFGEREGTSNEALGSEVMLQIKGGKALIIRDLKLSVKHGLL